MASIDRVMALAEELKKKKKDKNYQINQSAINVSDLANDMKSGNTEALKNFIESDRSIFDAPIKTTVTNKSNVKDPDKKWYQQVFTKGEFEDGVDGVGDFFSKTGKTILGTGMDLTEGLVKGMFSPIESVVDIGTNIGATALNALGKEDTAKKWRDFADKDLTSNFVPKVVNATPAGIAYNILNGEPEKALNPTGLEWDKDKSVFGNAKQAFNKAYLTESNEAYEDSSVMGYYADKTTELVGYALGLIYGGQALTGATGTKAVGLTNTAGKTMVGASASGGNIGLTLNGMTLNVPTLAFTGGMASGLQEANSKENITEAERWTKAFSSGAIEGATEGLFGMFGVGGVTNQAGQEIFDVAGSKAASLFKSSVGKTLANAGIKATGETAEEFIAYSLNYLSDNHIIDKMGEADFSNEWNWKELGETLALSFASSMIMQGGGGVIQTNSAIAEAEKQLGRKLTSQEKALVTQASIEGTLEQKVQYIEQGRDYNTGLTQNEQSIVDKEVESRKAELEQEGTKLTKKQITEIEKQVRNELEKGYISTDTIESALGGETYNVLKSTRDTKTNLENQIAELESKPNAEITVKEMEQLQSLREQLKSVDTNTLENNLRSEIGQNIKSDTYLQRSYQEKANRSVQFEADLTQYDAKQQKIVQKAIDSGVLNNTNRTHDFVDMVAKISADKGIDFDFTNNAKLKESGFAVEGKTVNGYIKDGAIAVNIDSSKALNRVVGHEITHVLEGTELYTELQNAVKQYATTKGEYDSRLADLTKLYKDVKGANVENELTADLVGDYLFTDTDFINNLSVEKPSLFKKVYNEIKHLYDMATAGSKEARELLKVKKAFEKAYKENIVAKTTAESKFAITEGTELYNRVKNEKVLIHATNDLLKIINSGSFNGEQLSVGAYDKGNKLVTYGEQIIKVKPEILNYADVIYENDAVTRREGTVSEKTKQKIKEINSVEELLEHHPRFYDEITFKGEIPLDVIEEVAIPKNSSTELIDKLTEMGVKINYTNRISNRPTQEIQQTANKVDSQGRTLTKEQTNFFKDSKVVDEDGNLLVMYHGTRADFNTFDMNKSGQNYEGDWSAFGRGFYFTPSQEAANEFSSAAIEGNSKNVKEVYLNITKPFYTEDSYSESNLKGKYNIDDATLDKGYKVIEYLNKNGYDSTTVLQELGYDGVIDSYNGKIEEAVAFEPNQIKNTDNTKPTLSKDIRYSLSEMGAINNLNNIEGYQVQEDYYPYDEVIGHSFAVKTKEGEAHLQIRETDKEVYLNMINTRLGKNQPEKGTGTKILNNLKEYSDMTGKKLIIAGEVGSASGFYDKFDWLKKVKGEIYDDNGVLFDIESPNRVYEPNINDTRYSLSEENGYRGSHQIENARKIIELDLNDIQNKVIEANGYLTKQDYSDLNKLKKIFKSPNDNVKIYRASPVNELNSGDWVTTDKSYAKNVANQNGGKVYEYEVKPSQLYYPDNVKELPSLHRLSSFQYIEDTVTKNSLSNQNEQIAPSRNDVFSKDIRLEIAPLQEEVKALTETVTELKEQLATNQEEIAPTTEEGVRQHTKRRQETFNNEIANENHPRISDEFIKELTEQSIEWGKRSGKIAHTKQNASNTNITEDIAPIRKAFNEKVRESAKEIEKELGYLPKDPTKESSYDEIAEILTEEPKTQNDRNKRKAAIIAANVLDKGLVFENVALKNKNRELMAKWDYTLTSEARAQTTIGQGHYDNETGKTISKSLNEIMEEVNNTGLTKQFYEYIYHKHNVDRMQLADKFEGMKNKPVFGEHVTAKASQEIVNQYEFSNPEFMDLARDVYEYVNADRKVLVDNGVISQETADLWSKMYPHYVPIRRAGHTGNAVNVPLDTGRTGINAPIKKATGGSSDILPLFDTMASRTLQTYRAAAKNSFGVELKNTIGTTINSQATSVDEVIDSVDAQESLLQEGKAGQKPTFTVFEDGKKITFEITEDMYDALKPLGDSSILSKTIKPLNIASSLHRGLLTQYNPVFAITNGIKDIQDVVMNSQHTLKTYSKIPEAYAQIFNKGYWYQEYMANGGEHNSYFDSQDNTFKTENKGISKLLDTAPLKQIAQINDFIESVPRLAEYIASREMGRSIEVSMLDAARVTTNFKAGGNLTKFLNRNGATFLNASVQGAMQQVRNIREAKANGIRGWANLATKFTIAGLPAFLLNALLWDDDDDYEELSDYVKQNYYVVAKTDDGKFIRIPKGRATAVIQDAIEQSKNFITGDDEVDLASFIDLMITNLAPSNPIESNIFAPIIQVANNETWYGEDLVPTRLQDLPAAEQYDESTDMFSRWLGEKTGWSPYKINYLLDQYSGGLGDVLLPPLTPEAESGDDSFLGNMIAPLKSKFTTDAVMNNQNVSDFYSLSEELTTNAKKSNATDEDVLKNKYINSVKAEMNELYAEKREIQNSDLPSSEKYNQVREIQSRIVDLTKQALNSYEDIDIYSNYASVGDRQYTLGSDGEWKKINDKQLEKQNAVTDMLGIRPNEYWSNKEEYDYAYENPSKYAVATAITDYSTFKTYSSELYDIKADKDSSGKSISGSRKTKVFDYINNLDLGFEQRVMLAKLEYPSYDEYNYEIIEYLNNRDDIDYQKMVLILTELGFTVDSEGNIYWD